MGGVPVGITATRLVTNKGCVETAAPRSAYRVLCPSVRRDDGLELLKFAVCECCKIVISDCQSAAAVRHSEVRMVSIAVAVLFGPCA